MSKAYMLILVVNLVVGLSSSALSKQKLEKYNASKENLESAATASLDNSDLDLLLRILSNNLSTNQADSLEKKIEKLRNEMEVEFVVSFFILFYFFKFFFLIIFLFFLTGEIIKEKSK